MQEAALPPALPDFVFLEEPLGSRLAGSVLRADADLIAALDSEGIKYRPASAIERGLAGFAE